LYCEDKSYTKQENGKKEFDIKSNQVRRSNNCSGEIGPISRSDDIPELFEGAAELNKGGKSIVSND
jgi:hypothetical protein